MDFLSEKTAPACRNIFFHWDHSLTLQCKVYLGPHIALCTRSAKHNQTYYFTPINTAGLGIEYQVETQMPNVTDVQSNFITSEEVIWLVSESLANNHSYSTSCMFSISHPTFAASSLSSCMPSPDSSSNK